MICCSSKGQLYLSFCCCSPRFVLVVVDHINIIVPHTHTDTRTDCMCIVSCENFSCVNCSIKSTSVFMFFLQPNDRTVGAGSVPHPAFPHSPRRRRIRARSSNRRSRHNSNSHNSYHKATRSMDPSPSQPAAMPRCNLSRRSHSVSCIAPSTAAAYTVREM